MNRQIVLRRRPSGLVQPDDTELITMPAPEPAEGEALVRTTYIGIDAAARTWLNDQPGYLPPVQLGEVIHPELRKMIRRKFQPTRKRIAADD